MSKRKLISFDWALKRLLRSKANYEVLEGFLSELLREEITILEILESESNKQERTDKFNRVDLKVNNQLGEIILIEVQYEREFDYLQRILYATSKAITEDMVESQTYDQVIKVISVNILYFDLGQGQDYVYYCRPLFKGIHTQDELKLNVKQQEIFGKHRPYQRYSELYILKIKQFDDVIKDGLDEWIFFLKNEEIKNEFQAKGLKKAKEVLDRVNLSEEDRVAYESFMEDLRYQASMYQSSYGVGFLEGQTEGRVEDQAKSRTEEKMNMAKLMKQNGEPIKKIMHYTHLSKEDIESI